MPSTASSSVKVAGSAERSAVATCPVGTVVVGGGYNAGASLMHREIVERLEAPTPRQWAVTVLNISAAATTLSAIAYCSHGAAPSRHATTLHLPAHGGGTARVSCPRNTSIVVGGLVAHSPVVAKKAAAIAPFSWTAASNSQWVVSGYNAGDAPGTLDALVYCR